MEETKVKIELESTGAINSIKDLRKAIKSAKDEMVGLEEGSQAFIEAANRAGELQHQMQAISEAVRGASADFGDMLGNTAKVGAGLTGAFQAAQGAMQLFGVESESVTKAIKDMQSIMAITQGLSAIDSAIKAYDKLNIAVKGIIASKKAEKVATVEEVAIEKTAQATKTTAVATIQQETTATFADATAKQAATLATGAQTAATGLLTKAWQGLSSAMSANPLGAIILALTAVISLVSVVVDKWDDWTGKTEKLEKAHKASENRLNSLSSSIDKNKSALDKLGKSQKYELDLLKAQGASTVDQKKKEIELTKVKIAETAKRIKAIESEYRATLLKEAAASGVVATQSGNQMSFSYRKTGEEEEDKRREAAAKSLADSFKAIQKLKEGQLELTRELRIQETELSKAQKDEAKKAAEDRKKALEQELKRQKELAANAKNSAKEREEAAKKALEKEKELLDIKKIEVELDDNKSAIEKQRAILKIEEDRLKLLQEGSLEYAKQQSVIAGVKNEIVKLRNAEEENARKTAEESAARLKAFRDAALPTNNKEETNRFVQLEKEKQEKLKELADAYAALTDEERLAHFEEYEQLKNNVVKEYSQKRAQLESEIDKETLEQRLNQYQEAIYQLSDIASGFDQISDGFSVAFDAIGNTIGQLTEAMNTFGDSSKDAGDKAAAGLKVASVAAQGVAGVLSAIAKEQDANTQEGFERQKKMQIGAATMQMLAGIATALSGAFTTKSGPWDIALAGVQATLIGAMGAAQIAKIKQQTFDGANSGAVRPNLSSTAAALTQPITYTQDVQNAETIGAISDARVYVTETDITSTQKKVDIAETESRF